MPALVQVSRVVVTQMGTQGDHHGVESVVAAAGLHGGVVVEHSAPIAARFFESPYFELALGQRPQMSDAPAPVDLVSQTSDSSIAVMDSARSPSS